MSKQSTIIYSIVAVMIFINGCSSEQNSLSEWEEDLSVLDEEEIAPSQMEPAPVLSFEEQVQKVLDKKAAAIIATLPAINDEDIAKLAACGEKLSTLELTSPLNNVTDYSPLLACPQLIRLKLDMPVGGELFPVLAKLKNLRVLNLPQGKFSNEDLAKLLALKNLELLRFSSPHVTDKAMSTIASLANLRFLHLIQVPITDAGLKAFHDSTDLESFYIDGGQVTDEGLLQLLKALPELHLHRDQLHLPSDPHGHDHE